MYGHDIDKTFKVYTHIFEDRSVELNIFGDRTVYMIHYGCEKEQLLYQV